MTTPIGNEPWATVEDLPFSVVDLHDSDVWDRHLASATDILWALTGRQWRGASLTANAVLTADPHRDGHHTSWGGCVCRLTASHLATTRLAHTEPTRVRLPHRDVTAVTNVTIDGDTFTRWRLDGAYLTRTDGAGWPMCGDRTRITYDYGRPPPAAAVAACAELAAEFGRDAAGDNTDQECRLPARLRSVNRQGLSFDVVDSLDFLDKGLTGLVHVDLWIRSVNPSGRRSRAAAVWTPDMHRARRTL